MSMTCTINWRQYHELIAPQPKDQDIGPEYAGVGGRPTPMLSPASGLRGVLLGVMICNMKGLRGPPGHGDLHVSLRAAGAPLSVACMSTLGPRLVHDTEMHLINVVAQGVYVPRSKKQFVLHNICNGRDSLTLRR